MDISALLNLTLNTYFKPNKYYFVIIFVNLIENSSDFFQSSAKKVLLDFSQSY